MSIEKPEYDVVFEQGDVEFRQYQPYLVSETVIEATDDYKGAGNEGFRRLFRYITGNNRSQSKIAMTAPVQQSKTSEKIAMTAPVQRSETASGYAVAFMLPSKYTMETAPEPTDPKVAIREVPGRLVAVIRYSGRWTESNFEKRREQLLAALDASGVEPVGVVESALYDAPYKLPFLRRNEVMVEVDGLPAEA